MAVLSDIASGRECRGILKLRSGLNGNTVMEKHFMSL